MSKSLSGSRKRSSGRAKKQARRATVGALLAGVMLAGCGRSDPPKTLPTTPAAPLAAGGTSDPPHKDAPDIQLADHGVIRGRSIVAHEFELRNNGPGTWQFTSLTSDCTCTTGKLDRSGLAPGENASLQVQVNTGARAGSQTHSVTASGTIDGKPHTWECRVSFDAKPLLVWPSDHEVINLGEIPASTLPADRTLSLGRGSFPLDFDAIQVAVESADPVTATSVPVDRDRWSVQVKFEPSKRIGPIRGRLRITPMRAGAPAGEPDERHIFGTVVGAVEVSPRSLLIGVAGPGQSFQQDLKITGAGTGVRLLRVESNGASDLVPFVSIMPGDKRSQDESTISLQILAPVREGQIDCDLVFEAGAFELRVPLVMRVIIGKGDANPSATKASATPTTTLQAPVDLWMQGHRDEAVAALLAAPWSDPSADFSSRLLTMNEQTYLKLESSERESLEPELVALTAQLPVLVVEALQRAERLADSGKAEEASRIRTAVRGLGERLADPDHRLAVLNLLGKSTLRRVTEAESGTHPTKVPGSEPPRH